MFQSLFLLLRYRLLGENLSRVVPFRDDQYGEDDDDDDEEEDEKEDGSEN